MTLAEASPLEEWFDCLPGGPFKSPTCRRTSRRNGLVSSLRSKIVDLEERIYELQKHLESSCLPVLKLLELRTPAEASSPAVPKLVERSALAKKKKKKKAQLPKRGASPTEAAPVTVGLVNALAFGARPHIFFPPRRPERPPARCVPLGVLRADAKPFFPRPRPRTPGAQPLQWASRPLEVPAASTQAGEGTAALFEYREPKEKEAEEEEKEEKRVRLVTARRQATGRQKPTAKQRALVQRRRERERDKAFHQGYKMGKDEEVQSWPSVSAPPAASNQTQVTPSFFGSDDSGLYGNDFDSASFHLPPGLTFDDFDEAQLPDEVAEVLGYGEVPHGDFDF